MLRLPASTSPLLGIQMEAYTIWELRTRLGRLQHFQKTELLSEGRNTFIRHRPSMHHSANRRVGEGGEYCEKRGGAQRRTVEVGVSKNVLETLDITGSDVTRSRRTSAPLGEQGESGGYAQTRPWGSQNVSATRRARITIINKYN